MAGERTACRVAVALVIGDARREQSGRGGIDAHAEPARRAHEPIGFEPHGVELRPLVHRPRLEQQRLPPFRVSLRAPMRDDGPAARRRRSSASGRWATCRPPSSSPTTTRRPTTARTRARRSSHVERRGNGCSAGQPRLPHPRCRPRRHPTAHLSFPPPQRRARQGCRAEKFC